MMSRIRGAGLLVPVTVGVAIGCGALNASPPPDEGAEEGREAGVKISSGSFSDPECSSGGNSALGDGAVGV